MDKKLVTLIALFFATLLVFAYIILFGKPFSQFIRAKEEYEPSAKNSLIFAWPVKALADGTNKVTVHVFVRSGAVHPKPVKNRTVNVQSTIGDIRIEQGQSDNEGKTTFYITSDSPGIAELSAIIDNSVLVDRPLTVKFE